LLSFAQAIQTGSARTDIFVALSLSRETCSLRCYGNEIERIVHLGISSHRRGQKPGYFWFMPYRWTTEPTDPCQQLQLWPHNSLPETGMAAFVLATFTLILIPALPLLGSAVLWGLLPFLLIAVWGMYYALRRNRRARQIIEVLTLNANETRLTRTDANGAVLAWDCNRYWTRITKYEDEGPVPHYVTLKGKGREVEIGAFLSEEERIGLYEDLQRALRRTPDNSI
jgi:uncharacterized membrane protein